MTARACIGLLSLVLQACASSPPAAPETQPDSAAIIVLPAQPTAYETRQSALAVEHERRGRLAEAALAWEVLTTIRPNNDHYRERWAETSRKAVLAASERVQRGDQASARGQFDAAASHYLSAMALQPDNLRAADALRKIERERNRKNYLGKLSRHTLTRKAMADADMSASLSSKPSSQAASTGAKEVSAHSEDNKSAVKPASRLGQEDRIVVEHASLLASQGEYADAAAMLEPWLANNRRDDAARSLMADILFQQAQTLAASNPQDAIALLERSLQFNRKNSRAAEHLKQLKTTTARKRP